MDILICPEICLAQERIDLIEIIQEEDSDSIFAIPMEDSRSLFLCNRDVAEATVIGDAYIFGDTINTFVYQIDRELWGKFLGLDIVDIPVILSGGNLDENYNLLLTSDRELYKYPGTTETNYVSYIRTKEYYIEKGVFQRWLVDFEGEGVDVETRVKRRVGNIQTTRIDLKTDVIANKLRGISLNKQRGRSMSIKIIDAEIIKSLLYDAKKWGEQ